MILNVFSQEEQAGVELRHRFMRTNSQDRERNSETRSYTKV